MHEENDYAGNSQPVGPLVGLSMLTLLCPIVGLVAGIVSLFKAKIGPGFALIALGLLMGTIYALLLLATSAPA